MFSIITRLVLTLGLLSVANSAPAQLPSSNSATRRTPTLLISFDGYRADYLDKFLAENPESYLQKLFVEVGVKAEYMVPSFPSLTFPNHYTLVTGQYMENHGIVGNTFYDPKLKEKVNLIKDSKGNDVRFWNQSEPIWLSAKRQGLKTGSFFWTGSEVWGQHPDVFISYNPTIEFEARCDEVVNWFDKFSMDFVTLYFNEPDHTGHDKGANSKEYWQKIVAVDKLLGVLMTKLENRNKLLDKINIVVVSDHGMADVSNNIALKHDLIDTGKSSFGIVSLIYPKKDSDLKKIYTDLKKTENVDVYYREEVPERLHFRNNARIAPIVVVAHEGFGVTLSSNILKGNHGYDNKYESMRAIFLARGPDFKLNQHLAPINNVDVYPLVCHLLSIECNPNNGTLSNFDQVLVNSPVLLK